METAVPAAPATRERLTRTALRLFAQRGYHAVPTREIVEACGLTSGAMYWYFRGKEDLFRTIVAENLAGFDERVRRAVGDADGQNAKLAAVFRMFVDILADDDDPHRDLLILLALRMPAGPGQSALGLTSLEGFVTWVEELVGGNYAPGEVAEVVALIHTAGLGVLVESALGLDVARPALGGLLRLLGGGSLDADVLSSPPAHDTTVSPAVARRARRGRGGSRPEPSVVGR